MDLENLLIICMVFDIIGKEGVNHNYDNLNISRDMCTLSIATYVMTL